MVPWYSGVVYQSSNFLYIKWYFNDLETCVPYGNTIPDYLFQLYTNNLRTDYRLFKWGRKLVMDVLCADEKRQEMPWNYRMLLLRNVEFGTASISTKRMIFRKLDTKVLRSIGQHFKAFILLPICYHDIHIIFLSILYFRSSKEIINLKNQLFHYIKSNEFWYQFYGS